LGPTANDPGPIPSGDIPCLDIPAPEMARGLGTPVSALAGKLAGIAEVDGCSSELVNSAPSDGFASRWSTLIVCVTSAAQRRCSSRFWMRSAKIDCVYAATSSEAMKSPRRMSNDCRPRDNSRAVPKRSLRSFASAFMTIFSRSSG
jgi:hypothetical protein